MAWISWGPLSNGGIGPSEGAGVVQTQLQTQTQLQSEFLTRRLTQLGLRHPLGPWYWLGTWLKIWRQLSYRPRIVL
jgi:hypothetical protein